MEVDATLLDNPREINRLTARLISFDVIVHEAFAAKFSGGGDVAAIPVLSKLNPAPEYVAPCGEKTPCEHSGSPILPKLKNGNRISFSYFHMQDNREFAVLFDPTTTEAGKIIQVPAPLFLERWGGVSIFLRNFPNPGFSPDSRRAAYFCLCAIGRNPGINIDLARLRHDFAVSDDGPAWGEFRKVADQYRLKCRPVAVPFNRLDSPRNALPAIIRKKDGEFAVPCGCRKAGEEMPPSVRGPLDVNIEARVNVAPREAAQPQAPMSSRIGMARTDTRLKNGAEDMPGWSCRRQGGTTVPGKRIRRTGRFRPLSARIAERVSQSLRGIGRIALRNNVKIKLASFPFQCYRILANVVWTINVESSNICSERVVG